MKINKIEIENKIYYYRVGYSDIKAIEEVAQKKEYFGSKIKIEPGNKVMDCGGNVGAFTIMAASLGAKVTVYEPDPFSIKLIEKSLKANNLDAEIIQAALVEDKRKDAFLFIPKNPKMVWRNSIVKPWTNKGVKVPCINFDNEVNRVGFDSCKMDIEGAEMPILEKCESLKDLNQLIFEWSFDIDDSLERIWKVIERLEKFGFSFSNLNSIRYEKRDYNVWQKNWIPKCATIYAYKNETN